MLNWLYKTFAPARKTPAEAPLKPKTAAAAPPAPKPPRPSVDWTPQLQAAQGNDEALLALAQATDALAVKLQAVEALASEDALKQAERLFRNHDRKVHRLAKQRLEAAVATREARTQADALLARTQALLTEAEVPANHLVMLDRDWAALPSASLAPAQREQFNALRAQLGTQVRERAEALRQAQRQNQQWLADAQQQLQGWPAALRQVADHGGCGELDALLPPLQSLQATLPPTAEAGALAAKLASALATAATLRARLAWLEAEAAQPAAAAPVSDTPALDAETPTVTGAEPALAAPPLPSAPTAPADAPAAATAPQPAWDSLPSLPDAALMQALQQRHARLRPPAPARAASAPAPAREKAPRPPKAPPMDAAQLASLEALMAQAEAALAEGHVGPAQQPLQAFDNALAAQPGAPLPGPLRQRQQALKAELARLKGWQRWGGDRARDDLAAEAEALAALVPAPAAQAVSEAESADPGSDNPPSANAAPAAANETPTPAPTTPPAPAAPLPKLNLKTHADAIRQLRQRWKELDRAGAAASAAQWQRFDNALQTAYGPVAAQQAQLQAERQQNLAHREALLATLDQWALPLAGEGDGDDGTATQLAAHPAAWRDTLRELDRFQQAWRQLGPVEHTVPADARAALQQRLQASLARVEQPLDAVRRQAAAQREPLIAQAEALAAARLALPEALRQVRDLQAAWQDAARQIPLARAAEAALWARFKAATDQVYAQREAQFAEREAAQATGVAEREALLQRLAEVAADATATDITRTLAEVDTAWRQASELPRAVAAPLDAQLRAAREPLQQRLAQASQRRWQAQRDALAARLALCEAREDGIAPEEAEAQWDATSPLPKAWQQALAQRWQQPAQTGPLAAADVDAALLQLEMAWDLPTAPEWQEARRQLKLQGLKQALEARQASAPQAAEAHWLALLKQAGLSPAQRARLAAVVAALPAELAGSKRA